MPRLTDLPAALEELRQAGLLRIPDQGEHRELLLRRFGSDFIDASSNDYLGLGRGSAPRAGLLSSQPPSPPPGHSEGANPSGVVSRETAEVALTGQLQVRGLSSAKRVSRETAERSPSEPPEGPPLQPGRSSPAPRSASPQPGRWDPDPQLTTIQTPDVSRETPVSPLSGSPEPRHLDPRGDVSRETGLSNRDTTEEELPPPGSGASRLIHGTHRYHLEVERKVAEWLGKPSSLLFASGYAANLGALSALLDRNDLVISDALNHASLIDGIRLSRAETIVTPHLDLAAVESALASPTSGARWVVVESYYSMDGDIPDLKKLRALCDAAGAYLYVDEAHAIGLFGQRGAGLLQEAHIQADVIMTAFGKAVGCHGAAISSSEEVRTWLWNRARSFVFSTAPSPRHARELLLQIERTQAAESSRDRVEALSHRLRKHLESAGLPLIPGSRGPIIGLIAGSPTRALALNAALRERGILAQAIRPPTVPDGQSRLRITLSSTLSDAAVDRLADTLLEVFSTVKEI